MSVSAEKCVIEILKKIRERFNGLEEEAVQEFQKIMVPRIRTFGEKVRQEATAQAGGGEAAPEKPPKLRRVTNYTMFGKSFREEHREEIEAKKMFKAIGEAWSELSKDEQDEWKVKADEQNEEYKKEYIAEHGALPQKGKPRTRARTTNAFQQYVADFRKDNKDVNHKEVFSKAAAKWKKMTAKQKKKYEDRAEKLKAQYREEWERYKEENPQVVEQAAGGKKKKKDKEPRPSLKTGYILWGDHWRSKLNSDSKTGKEAMSAIGESWNKLKKAEQEKYKKQATKANESVITEFVKLHPDIKWTVNYRKRQEKAKA